MSKSDAGVVDAPRERVASAEAREETRQIDAVRQGGAARSTLAHAFASA